MNLIEINIAWFLHALLLFTALSIFYITIKFELLTNKLTKSLSTIIKNILPDNLNFSNIIDSIINLFLNKHNISSNSINYNLLVNEINNNVDNINDPQVDSNNTNLINTIIITNIILWIIFIIGLVIIKKKYTNIYIYKIIKHTIIIFAIIGVIEVILYNYIVFKYISVSSSDMQNYIITRLLNKL